MLVSCWWVTSYCTVAISIRSKMYHTFKYIILVPVYNERLEKNSSCPLDTYIYRRCNRWRGPYTMLQWQIPSTLERRPRLTQLTFSGSLLSSSASSLSLASNTTITALRARKPAFHLMGIHTGGPTTRNRLNMTLRVDPQATKYLQQQNRIKRCQRQYQRHTVHVRNECQVKGRRETGRRVLHIHPPGIHIMKNIHFIPASVGKVIRLPRRP